MKRKHRLWLGKSKSYTSHYRIGTKKSLWDGDWFREDSFMRTFCASDFEKYTGIKLKPGECREITSLITLKLRGKAKIKKP